MRILIILGVIVFISCKKETTNKTENILNESDYLLEKVLILPLDTGASYYTYTTIKMDYASNERLIGFTYYKDSVNGEKITSYKISGSNGKMILKQTPKKFELLEQAIYYNINDYNIDSIYISYMNPFIPNVGEPYIFVYKNVFFSDKKLKEFLFKQPSSNLYQSAVKDVKYSNDEIISFNSFPPDSSIMLFKDIIENHDSFNISINYLPSSSNQKYNRINNLILSRVMLLGGGSENKNLFLLNNQFNLSGSKNNAIIQKILINRKYFNDNYSDIYTYSYRFDSKGRVIQVEMYAESQGAIFETWKLYYKNE